MMRSSSSIWIGRPSSLFTVSAKRLSRRSPRLMCSLTMLASSSARTPRQGFEMQLGVNNLGHFLLTHLLLDLLKSSAPRRIVVVSSKLYKYGHINFNDLHSTANYKAFCYSQSKLANLLFTRELAQRLDGTGITVNTLTPGMVRTYLGRHIHILARPLFKLASWLYLKSPLEGAQTPLYFACLPGVDSVTGKCFTNCEEEELQPKATDNQAAQRLWIERVKGVHLDLYHRPSTGQTSRTIESPAVRTDAVERF